MWHRHRVFSRAGGCNPVLKTRTTRGRSAKKKGNKHVSEWYSDYFSILQWGLCGEETFVWKGGCPTINQNPITPLSSFHAGRNKKTLISSNNENNAIFVCKHTRCSINTCHTRLLNLLAFFAKPGFELPNEIFKVYPCVQLQLGEKTLGRCN